MLTVYELVEGDGTKGNGRFKAGLDIVLFTYHVTDHYRYSRYGH